MLSENSSGQYLKYAFREIVLVVIGILLALQINNWYKKWRQAIEDLKEMIDEELQNQ